MNAAAIALSYLVELILLPVHAYRLARMRLATRQGVHRLKWQMQAELDALAELVRQLTAAETMAAEADLTLERSHQALAHGLQAALCAMEARLHPGPV